MRHRQVLHFIPFERLRPSVTWGRRAVAALVAGSLVLLLCHALAHRFVLPEWGVGLLVLAAMAAAGRWHVHRNGVIPLLSGAPATPQRRPDASSVLLAWTCAGDVIELIFDSGAWLLVRGDVNDRQWRDVQRLLLWCKRVFRRACQLSLHPGFPCFGPLSETRFLTKVKNDPKSPFNRCADRCHGLWPGADRHGDCADCCACPSPGSP